MQASILTMLENARWYLDAYEYGFWVLEKCSWFYFSLKYLSLKIKVLRVQEAYAEIEKVWYL